MLTQLKIAEKVGVSRTTVAYALSDDPQAQKQIGPRTRQRIAETARQLGYRPHRHAQLLRGKKSGLIGIIKTISYVQAVVERSFHVSKAIQTAGYGLLVHELLWDKLGERQAVNMMLDERVEGVVLESIGAPEPPVLADLQRLRDAKIPTVAIGNPSVPGVVAVDADYRQGTAEVTRHLLARGYRKLTFVCPVLPVSELDSPYCWDWAERVAGFRAVVQAAGLSAEQARVLHVAPAGWANRFAPGREAVEQLKAGGDPPEALICDNDDIAIAVLDACRAAGWRVPEDVAVTGFGNNPICDYIRPRLTSVVPPTEAVARRAIEILLSHVRGAPISSKPLETLPCKLVIRQSCK